MKRFNEGGFSKEQEEWLGGADRTDPYILARMRSAVPNKEKDSDMETMSGKNKMIDDDTRSRAMDFVNKKTPESKPEIKKKAVTTKPVTPKPADTKTVSPKSESTKTEEKTVAQEKEKPVDNNEYLNRSRSVVEGAKNAAKQLTTLRNYDPLQKMGDVFSGIRKWGQTPLDEQAKKFRSYSSSNMKKGGSVKASSASKRADGCAIRGKTRA